MIDEEAQISATTTTTTTTTRSSGAGGGAKNKGSLLKSLGRDGAAGGGGKYKFWVLGAILLLAFWSMFTGSVTLKWSTGGTLNALSGGDFDPRINNDLDILEVEEREKLVKHMWDVYTQSKSIQLPEFWQVAFKAAYMNLISEVSNVRDAAFYEIAKMSFHRPALLKHHLVPPSSSSSTFHSTSSSTGTSKNTKEEAKLSGEAVKTTRLLLL